MPNKYSAAHKKPQGPGDARPTALQIVEDEGLVNKLGDKVFVVTGTSSGIGIDTAVALAATGATVYCTARNVAKAEAALGPHRAGVSGKLEVVELDNGSLASVREGAAEILRRSGGQVNVLVCNAGIMRVPTVERTTDGFESQFGTNHVAHFLLFMLLKDALLRSSTPAFNSRVVALSSSGHREGPARVADGDYDFSKGDYSPTLGYGQSKTANIWMANHIDRLYGSQGLHATSVMPGGIATGLQVHIQDQMEALKDMPEILSMMKSCPQGAATSVWAAVAKEWEGKGGKYLENVDVAPLKTEKTFFESTVGYLPHAYDEESEKKLWADSLKMVGLEA